MVDDIDGLRRVLAEDRVIAVVGLSANWYRPNYFAAKYMQERGYKVIPVNPAYREVLGEKCYPSLLDIPEKVDMVDCFRKAEDIPPLVEDAIAIGARTLWLQLGVINHEAAAKADAGGLRVVMDRCVKIEYARLFGGLGWFGVNTGVISSRRPPCRPARLDPEREQFGGQRGVIGDPRPRAAEMCLRSLDPEAADIDAVETKQWQLARIAAGRASVIPAEYFLEPEAGGQLVVGVVSPVVEVAGDDEGRITGASISMRAARASICRRRLPANSPRYADAVRIDR